MTDSIDNLDDLAKKYGIRLVTPQDRLDSYFEGLKLIRGRPGCELGEAQQWEAIGDQYMRMNKVGLAKVAYGSALKALQKAQTSEWFKSEEQWFKSKEKEEWEKQLLAKLDG